MFTVFTLHIKMFVDLKIYILQFVVVVIGSNVGSNVMFMRNMRLDFEKFYKNPQKTLLVGEILPKVPFCNRSEAMLSALVSIFSVGPCEIVYL